MVRMQIQLTDEQFRQLEALVVDEGISISELIRRCVDDYLRTQASPDLDARRRRALAVIGKYRSGSSDGSAEHDRYLVKIYGENV